MEFIKPSLEYIDSYIEAQSYLEKEGIMIFRTTSEEIKRDKLKFISEFRVLETEKCVEIVSFFVPSISYWLIDEEKKKFIGFVSIRNRLSESLINIGGHIGYAIAPKYRKKGYGGKLLDKGLKVAKELGLGEVLVTCDSDNIGSKKIIESREGIFINYYQLEDKTKLRYRIKVNCCAEKMWREFLKIADDNSLKKDEFNYKCIQFGKSHNELGELIRLGIKKATTSLKYLYEIENERYPQIGDYNIVLNSEEEAICIIKIIDVKSLNFCDVNENFAKLEGEGDKTLMYWNRVHKAFFEEELVEYKKEFAEDMEVILEKFLVVYK